MLNINLFAGPGCGKSFTAAGLFYKLKRLGLKTEYIQEYAKDLVYARDFTRLSDHLLVISNQHHRMFRMQNSVDFLIHDSPFLLGLAYLEDDQHFNRDKFNDLIIDMFKSYENVNIFLERDMNQPFEKEGRHHDLEASLKKDQEIKDILIHNDIPFITIKMSDDVIEDIIHYLKIRLYI